MPLALTECLKNRRLIASYPNRLSAQVSRVNSPLNTSQTELDFLQSKTLYSFAREILKNYVWMAEESHQWHL